MDPFLAAPYTVTELTREIKDLLEGRFGDLWVEGEVSNLRIPASGHVYFTLGDDLCQIRAVLFRTHGRLLRFTPKDGLHVLVRGRVSVYDKRGEYQLLLTAMEPLGLGALQLALTQLKERLEKEGLFDPGRKKALPALPQRIGIVTSPTGAVIQDMVRVIQRRFENVHLRLYPVRVQGEGAGDEIARGIDYFSRTPWADVIIIGRGGGSTEDLWAFNDEKVVRAISRSDVPVISAVGHETDYTLADFAADLRAATPSAAAELVVRDKGEIGSLLFQLRRRLDRQLEKVLQERKTRLSHLEKGLTHPRMRLEEALLRVDDLGRRLQLLVNRDLHLGKEKRRGLEGRLLFRSPGGRIAEGKLTVSAFRARLTRDQERFLDDKKHGLDGLMGRLGNLNPLAILERGYSITRKIPSMKILRQSSEAVSGDRVEVRLHRGSLLCLVEEAERP
jgi:exodeoxyribonuclease VII large subunit